MNKSCEEYQKIQSKQVIKYGQTKNGIQRYRCKICRKTFVETKGTFFYRLHHSEEDVIDCMAMLGDRNSLAAIHRIKGIKEETVCSWIEKIKTYIEQLEERVLLPYIPKCIQIDALWSFVGHKGEKKGGVKKRQEERFGELPPLT